MELLQIIGIIAIAYNVLTHKTTWRIMGYIVPFFYLAYVCIMMGLIWLVKEK